MAEQSAAPQSWVAYNYCISFVDLLGQREALREQGLLPEPKTEDEKKAFNRTIKDVIGSIYRLQQDAQSMLDSTNAERKESPLRKKLSPAEQATWDEMQLTRVTTQRWSDGLVAYVCLGDQDVKCPMNGVFSVLVLAGTLCFMGLGRQQPIRGAIDIAWGMELRPGELYGPVVARAYELESSVAQYPRIVISHQTVRYLEAHRKSVEQDYYTRFNRVLAELCTQMLVQDVDGNWNLHYLGDAFIESVTKSHHAELYDLAYKYVTAQLAHHRNSHNTKLAFRYVHLLKYFEDHSPPIRKHRHFLRVNDPRQTDSK